MSEPTRTDRWAEIASALGVEPPPAEEKPSEQELAAAVSGEVKGGSAPGVAGRPSRPKAKPAPKRSPADWSRVAADLGLTPPAEPPAAAPPPAPTAAERPRRKESRETKAPPPPPSLFDVAAIEAEAGQVLPGFEELAEELNDAAAILADDVLKPAGAISDEEEEFSPALAEADRDVDVDKAAAKRRRKRRRRPRKPMEEDRGRVSSEPAIAESDAVTAAPVETPPSADDLRQTPGESVAAPAAAEGDAAAKSKRRRRRRGVNRKRDHGDGDKDRLRGEPGESLAEDEYSLGPAGDDQDDAESPPAEDDAEDGEHSERLAHRGIPTWREAVDLVIAANLESRAKRPHDGSSSRQRPGRRPPRRDKPSHKSS